jgi:hypothetical protein
MGSAGNVQIIQCQSLMKTELEHTVRLLHAVRTPFAQLMDHACGAHQATPLMVMTTRTALVPASLILMQNTSHAQVTAQVTEDGKASHQVANNVNHGRHNGPMNTQPQRMPIQTLDWMAITAETQTVSKASGATPWTQRRDGTSVTH